MDDVARLVRSIVSGSEDPNRTSLGPMSVQGRRAAEVLGYDLRGRGEGPGQLKAESGFADVPAHEVTRDQMRELATG
ncbi:hypothetical protein ACGFZK_21290 [Streptomyces sp. NPDC048257]|uniref:hypothetical protein n=1 Tax=Streptomyces sp. NPDC048257 TaxID=3365526 RepID=UPI003714A13C